MHYSYRYLDNVIHTHFKKLTNQILFHIYVNFETEVT